MRAHRCLGRGSEGDMSQSEVVDWLSLRERGLELEGPW